MNRRLIALLLVLTLGLQSVTSAAMSVHAMDQAATHSTALDHCGDADPSMTENRSCCSDTGMSTLECAAYCAVAIAIVPSMPSFGAELRVDHAISLPAPLFNRSDAPPTPPPIA